MVSREAARQRHERLRLLQPALDTDAEDLTWSRRSEGRSEGGHEWNEIDRAIAASMEDNHRNTRGGDVLLIREIAVDRDQDREAGLAHEPEQHAIALAGPVLVADVRNGKVRQFAPKPSRHALVEQDPAHAAEARATSMSFASSRTAMAWARSTDGKSSRNSSSGSPASR